MNRKPKHHLFDDRSVRPATICEDAADDDTLIARPRFDENGALYLADADHRRLADEEICKICRRRRTDKGSAAR